MRAERKTFFLPKDGKSAICHFELVYKEDAMIEIAIDGNLDDSFLGKERPSFVVNSFNGSSFDDYRKEAASFIKYFIVWSPFILKKFIYKNLDNSSFYTLLYLFVLLR